MLLRTTINDFIARKRYQFLFLFYEKNTLALTKEDRDIANTQIYQFFSNAVNTTIDQSFIFQFISNINITLQN